MATRRRRIRTRYPKSSSPTGAVAACSSHLDALYVLAWLYTGDDLLAEEAVVDAMVRAAKDPGITTGDPARVWSLLAACFRVPNKETVVLGSIAATVRMADLTIAQRETMALIVTGCTPGDVAALLEVPSGQVREDFCAGAWVFNTAMGAGLLSPTSYGVCP